MGIEILFDASNVLGKPVQFLCNLKSEAINSEQLISQVLPGHEAYAVYNGKLVSSLMNIPDGACIQLLPRLRGGKGGFGSMLRAIGTQIEKTTNREACRDLSGRRLRDINNEKKLRDWVAGEAERERCRAEARRERQQNILKPKQHKFEDREYDRQKQATLDNLDDAISQGLKEALSRKRLATSKPGGPVAKKGPLWLGLDSDEEVSSSDASDGSSPPSPAASPPPAEVSTPPPPANATADSSDSASPGAA